MSDTTIWEAQKSIEYVINGVAERGWIELPLDVDQFAELRKDQRFSEAQVAALYEQYFLPERHESDWQILAEIAQAIIKAITSSPVVDFGALAVAGGVIGNAAYDLIKNMCSYTATLIEKRLGQKASGRVASFQQIGTDAQILKTFFQKTPKARIEEIEQLTGIPREKIYPLLKLAGMNHYRRGTPCYWELP
jgi:hypothetical protein